MKIKILIFSFLLFGLLLKPLQVQAAEEFSSTYDIKYEVAESGETIVSEKVTLKNLTDKYYASSFTLLINASSISELAATDTGGPLEASQEPDGNKTKITVKFNQQLAGKDKEYIWNLKYKSRDFAQKQGKIWQVSIPKITSTSDQEKYNISISVPLGFGDPTSIIPEPTSQTESNGRLNLFFSKEQLVKSGILANFGLTQYFDFTLRYHLKNSQILPNVSQIALPPDTSFQQVSIDNIDPKPENVTIDRDGNYLATFKLDKMQEKTITVKGSVQLFLDRRQAKTYDQVSQAQAISYLQSQKYWDKDNQIIKGKLAEINVDPSSDQTAQKARAINKYVVETLTYDRARYKANNYERLGSITALTNADKALCSEFTDLFITMARAANIPTREVVGYAYSTNQDIRPLSLQKTLHAWPEYYDPKVGWVMIDPTWENTTGGVDYFSKFDLNHVTLAIRGQSSEQPQVSDDMEVKFGEARNFLGNKPNFLLNIPDHIYSGLPTNISLRIINDSPVVEPASALSLSTSTLKIVSVDENIRGPFDHIVTPIIPPFGHLEYDIALRTESLVSSFNDVLLITFGDQKVSRDLEVRPFFLIRSFPLEIVSILTLMILIYLLSVSVYFRKFLPLTAGKRKS